ncbi:MAG TPA: DUF2750 domain-containing protein [Roseimicrobium sp.]|nr:DUF2750 domain-containing protein [Roseimicrobium sp.]
MIQDPAASEEQYKRFIEQARETGQVWGLRSEEGWACCESSEFENTEVLVFWSDKAQAQKNATNEWSKHQPEAIPMEEFLDNWLEGMDEDGALVGPNWDPGLCGLEVEPHEMAEKLDAGNEDRK